MVKPRGRVQRHRGLKQVPYAYFEVESFEVAGWCPDAEAQEPMEQVHLLLHIKDLSEYPVIVCFKSSDTIGFMIEELAAFRHEVWPDAEPLDVCAQTPDPWRPPE